MSKPLKQPVSTLVILHDEQNHILLIERADRIGFWQSVTGSIENGETLEQTALREVWEETGIILPPEQLNNWHESSVYEIYHHWRHRYPEGVFENREHIFSACIPRQTPIKLSPKEHRNYGWFSMTEAAEKVFSPSNRMAILNLEQHLSISQR